MQLFILRHGHAQAEAAKDSLRELSERGTREVSDAINNNKQDLDDIDRIIVSPYVRAQQTASIVGEQLKNAAQESVEQEICDLLVPGGDPDRVIAHLYKYYHEQGLQRLLLVGHQPLLGILLDRLCQLEPGMYRLSTASLAALDVNVMGVGGSSLRWVHHVD